MSQKFVNNIEKIQQNLKEIEQTNQLRFDELFNTDFLSQCSSFTSLEDMFEKSGFKVENADDFKAIPDDEWEHFIVTNTHYASWKEMQTDAAKKLLNKRLLKGLK